MRGQAPVAARSFRPGRTLATGSFASGWSTANSAISGFPPAPGCTLCRSICPGRSPPAECWSAAPSYPNAWRRPPYHRQLLAWAHHIRVEIRIGPRCIRLDADGNRETGDATAMTACTAAVEKVQGLCRNFAFAKTVCAKAGRMRREGVPLPAGKFFDINPRPRRTRPKRKIAPPPPVDDSLAMNPCSIIELDRSRCHWPLGGLHDTAAQFCGGAAASGHRYCRHHLRIAQGRATWPRLLRRI
jgi:GcrA cell cycle regulator